MTIEEVSTLGPENRDMRAVRALLACALIAIQSAPGSALAADKWFLMERHGGCFPVRVLERTFPDLGNINDPEAFIQFVRAKGLTVSAKPVSTPAGRAIEVHVPEKGLALLFATAELCPK